jgi:hypothetical protein
MGRERLEKGSKGGIKEEKGEGERLVSQRAVGGYASCNSRHTNPHMHKKHHYSTLLI